jgi:hypothetical protein
VLEADRHLTQHVYLRRKLIAKSVAAVARMDRTNVASARKPGLILHPIWPGSLSLLTIKKIFSWLGVNDIPRMLRESTFIHNLLTDLQQVQLHVWFFRLPVHSLITSDHTGRKP